MSDYITPEEFESKLSLVIRKPQEGKTFICISNITGDKTKTIHIVLTMNTLSAGMQFFGRMEETVGSKKIIVFNSKKQTAGECLYAKNITDVLALITSNPDIKVIVCCAHEKRIRDSIPELLDLTSDSMTFKRSGRKFVIHIDEAHKYIPENQDFVRKFNSADVVKHIIGYSGSPDDIWESHQVDPLFHKIHILDVEKEFSIIRSPDYFGVKNCEFNIIEEDISPENIVKTSILPPKISDLVYVRANSSGSYNWYKNDFPFELGNEYALLSFYDYILPRLEINPSQFSYHFVPAYTRRVTHFECVELLLKHFPTANVILINGLGTDLFRFNSTRGKTVNVNSVTKLTGFASVEEKKKLLEPSYQIQQLIKDTPNCPTFVTGFHCVGMSVTLINEHIGNFDSVLMAHEHYSRAKLYQLCRFLFNFSSWSPENRAKIKRTKFYSMTKYVADTCCEYEESVEKMCTEYAGKTCSLNEIQGKEPEQPTEREIKKDALKSIKVNNEKLWRKFKVYDGNDEEIWNKVKEFYEIIMDKKLEGKSMPKTNNEGFYECSTTKHVEIQLINNIKKLEEQSWWSTFQLTQSLNYARVFVGYESLIDSSEYTIFVKYVELEDSDKTREVLTKYGK
jgi:hypothetical protein